MTHQDPSHVQSIGMPNPASAHCIKIGGRLEIRNDADGAVKTTNKSKKSIKKHLIG